MTRPLTDEKPPPSVSMLPVNTRTPSIRVALPCERPPMTPSLTTSHESAVVKSASRMQRSSMVESSCNDGVTTVVDVPGADGIVVAGDASVFGVVAGPGDDSCVVGDDSGPTLADSASSTGGLALVDADNSARSDDSQALTAPASTATATTIRAMVARHCLIAAASDTTGTTRRVLFASAMGAPCGRRRVHTSCRPLGCEG